MSEERDEVYERIPWESLEKKGAGRQWIVYAVAGAVALGALAYSFVRSQPVAPAPLASAPESAPTSVPPTTTIPASDTPASVTGPVVMAEADLYAVDPERLIDEVVAHAEWVAVEYVAFDGSEESQSTLASLLPTGVGSPQAPDGTQVFVDWARAAQVEETAPRSFEVSVLVRSLGSSGEGGFVRQPSRTVIVPVEVGEDGPRVTGVPGVAATSVVPPSDLTLTTPPEEVLARIEAGTEVVGGRQLDDGSWEVVVMFPGPDGVTRPASLRP
jgi:hypothetical protein